MNENSEIKIKPAQPTLAVGAVVFKDRKVLMVRRGNAPAKGQWAIPGGRVNLGETLKAAAEREILEETGIHIKAGEPVYAFESIERNTDGDVLFHYYIVDLIATFISGEITPGDDAADAAWMSADDIKAAKVNAKTSALLNQLDWTSK